MIRSKIEWFALTVGLLTSLLLGQQAAAADPDDLHVTFRSATASNRFRIGEVIPVEVALSSPTPNRYLEPCALFRESNFGFPQCRFFSRWSFAITPESGWVDYTKEFVGPVTSGGPTFEVRPHYLASQPLISSYVLTNRFRFDKPGEYTIQFQLDLGFDDEVTKVQPEPHRISVTREITLQIVPADTEWQTEIVRNGAEAWFVPRPRETNPPSQSLIDYRHAKQALCTLGTPEAARVLAKAILPADFEAQNCLERSPSLPAAIEEMKLLLVDPDIAVTSNFFSALVGFLNIEESKKVGGLFLSQETVDKERDNLFSALQQKRGDAQAVSLATVLQFPPRTKSKPGMELAYDLAFPTSVIEVAAANFERLPSQTQELMLGNGWDRIRSSLMIPAVRHRAEAGDGPAVLRWLELDSGGATEFIRKEIVRPQPRFSSYYLRLPDAALPDQENQIAANFAGFAPLRDDNDLVHSASLLHRYATRAVLPTVLPFIDAKLTDWPCSIQVPVLAYLLKVSPENAAPRVEAVLKAHRIQVCTGRLLTTLGSIEPSPVVERIALSQIKVGGPAAADGAYYLQEHALPQLKSTIWEELQNWHQRFVSSGAQKRANSGGWASEDLAERDIVTALTDAFEKAQAWTLTPDDAQRLQGLLGKDTVDGLQCTFQCGAHLSVGPAPAEYAIYGRANPIVEERQFARESMEYLNSVERLRYSINQYQCGDLKSLKNKLLQFPSGSTFVFAYEFSARDRDELVEISSFLSEHGYKVKNVQNWTFLASNPSH